jgi:hypothetical protein
LICSQFGQNRPLSDPSMDHWSGSRTHRIGWFAYCTDGEAFPQS